MDTTATNQTVIDIYKTLLSQENSNHTIFISVLLGITIIILGATWWWNKTGANSFINKRVKEEFEKKKLEINSFIASTVDESIKIKIHEMDKKFITLELDLYRAFAFALEGNKMYTYSIYYWAKSLDNAIFQEEGEITRGIASTLIANIKSLTNKTIHQIEYVKSIINKLPSTLTTEKKEILKLLEDCIDI
jgi:hypothetical protein